MGKESKNLENLDNPFEGFTVLKGEFSSPKEEVDNIVETPDDFVVDDTTDDLDVEATKKAEKALEEIAKKQEKAIKKKEKVEDVSDDEDLDNEEDTTTISKGSKNEPIEEDETGFKDFAKGLYEKGVLDFDDTDEEFEPSEEGIEKLISKTVQNRIDKWAQGLPEDYAQFLEYVQSGGNPKDFLNVYYGNHSWEEFNLESEDNQKLAVRESLRLVGESEEDIQDMIDEWEINGTLEKRAKSAITKLQKHEKTQKEEIVKIQKENAEKQKQAQLEYWNNFKKELYDKDEIAGFKLTPKVKDKLWDFMTAIDKKSGKTPYQQAIENNKDSSYLFAYLAMNNFNAEKLEEKVQTKVSSNMSKMLKNYAKDTKNKIRGGGTDDNYSNDPFAAFKQIK